MKTIVIYTSGTLGDHLPFIALGQALKSRGYRVCMAINQAMYSYAQSAGLEVFTLPEAEHGPEEARENAWSWDHWNYPNPRNHPMVKTFDVEMFFTQCQELVKLCREADLLVATSIRPQGLIIGSALGIPWMTLSVNPYSFWQPPAAENRLRRRRSMFREYTSLSELIQRTYKQLGVAFPIPPFSPGWLYARQIILACSPHFYQPDLNQFQPRSNITMTSFLFYQDLSWQDWEPDEKLRSFFEVKEEQKPIVMAFSSQPLEDPRHVLNMHAEAAARLGRRLVVQRGWADFKESDLVVDSGIAKTTEYTQAEELPQVLFLDFMPHDWLFTNAACSIQHGGIGSIGRALRASCPLLVEPFGHDQLYNAQKVVDLGVGLGLHPFKMTADDLTKALHTVIMDPGIRKRVDTLGMKLRAEDGMEATCNLIDEYLERPEVIRSQKFHFQVLP